MSGHLLWPQYCVCFTIAGTPHKVIIDVQTQQVTAWTANGDHWIMRMPTADEEAQARAWILRNKQEWTVWLPLVGKG